jgi:hypothetical protein
MRYWQRKNLIQSMALSNNSFNRSGFSLPFIVNLNAICIDFRPVNSGVRHASRKLGSQVLCDAAQKTDAELNDIL